MLDVIRGCGKNVERWQDGCDDFLGEKLPIPLWFNYKKSKSDWWLVVNEIWQVRMM